MREWQYWTRNKLQILDGYLSAFNQASASKSAERLYIDLMAGDPFNRDAETGEEFDGSARLALSASPPFTRMAFCDLPPKAKALDADLRQRFPDYPFQVYPGNCNETIDQVIADLRPWWWAPKFVFADQQAAEIHWTTLRKLAAFRSRKYKPEIWILVSPTMTVKGVAGTNAAGFTDRVDALYGSADWQRIQRARDSEIISAADYRDEMVNLLRWQLEQDLGYQMTARVPMHMLSGIPIYDMVFATDNFVGDKIMTHLYRKASEREPHMQQEARVRAMNKRDEESGQASLFEPDPSSIKVKALRWEPSNSWDPRTRTWW